MNKEKNTPELVEMDGKLYTIDRKVERQTMDKFRLTGEHAPPAAYAALRNLRSAVEEVAQAIHDMQKETVDMDGAVMAEVEVIKEHAGAGNSVRSVRAIRVPNMHKKERVYVVPINTEEASDG